MIERVALSLTYDKRQTFTHTCLNDLGSPVRMHTNHSRTLVGLQDTSTGDGDHS